MRCTVRYLSERAHFKGWDTQVQRFGGRKTWSLANKTSIRYHKLEIVPLQAGPYPHRQLQRRSQR
jgi:hypothetical protein